MSTGIARQLPRLPLAGKLDLTYRCNNTCHHCWLWLAPDAKQKQEELTFDEICRIIDEARRMGCQSWSISGGEPMLRPDFAEIFEYITRKSVHYSLNTNGTLITPEIAQLMKRRGRKMVALYGATSEVYDLVTRSPGSFEAMLRGIAYLKEAGAGFEVQIVPMRLNYHQYQEMQDLARSLSPDLRLGAAWLFGSSNGSKRRNSEIKAQRLNPQDVIVLDEPNPTADLIRMVQRTSNKESGGCGRTQAGDDRLFAACIEGRRDFHIDPYGQMSFCYFIKDPALRFDLRQGSFQEAWEDFIPGLSEKVRGGQEYRDNCGSCELRQDCRWCGVYGYLEHGRFSAKVDYLCQVAAESRRFKEDWKLTHLRYFQIGGITIQVTTDFPITPETFDPKIVQFQVDGPGEDNISLRLVSQIPPLSELKLGQEIYRIPPKAIYRKPGAWTYIGIAPDGSDQSPHSLAIFNEDHSQGSIFRPADFFAKTGLSTLAAFASDQVLLARVLADHQGCYLHSAGINIAGNGLLFVGHSGAGKSTMLKLLREKGEILCDDRIILRRWPEGFKIHGTWSHGELPDVSPGSALLRAILYLEQANSNELIPIENSRERISRFLTYVIRPLVTADWLEKILDLAGKAAVEVPAYRLRFDLSGEVFEVLKTLY